MNKEVAFATMVENIPQERRSSPALYGYFDNLFPGKVRANANGVCDFPVGGVVAPSLFPACVSATYRL